MTTKNSIINIKKINEKVNIKEMCKVLLIMFIVSYPLASSFLGIDLSDTGYHLYFFENAFTNTDKVSITTYFTTIVGWGWNELFGALGLWGFNFFELIIEWLAIFAVYKTFKDDLGDIVTLIGLCFGVVGTGTYLNIFNYHQFHVMLLTIMYCLMYRACRDGSIKYSFIAGIIFSVDVFARIGSIAAIASIVIFIYWGVEEKQRIIEIAKYIGAFVIGSAATGILCVGMLMKNGHMELVKKNILRLTNLATESETGYNMDSLWDKMIFDSLDATVSGFVFLSCLIVLLFACSYLFKSYDYLGKKFIAVVVGLVGIYVALYLMIYAFDVNPAEPWPQMTTGPRFILGICLTVSFLTFAYYAMGEKKQYALITVIGCMLMIFTIAGSNTGTKHIVLALWVIGPLVTYVIWNACKWLTHRTNLHNLNKTLGIVGCELKRGGVYLAFALTIFMFTLKFMHMAYKTVNFDEPNRTLLTHQVDSDKLKGLYTTERQAISMNGVLAAIDEVDEEQSLMVYGSALLYYYLTERESYIAPWVTTNSYIVDDFASDIKEKSKEKLPIILYCKTNINYGFREVDYDNLINSQKRASEDGKKEVLIEFLKEFDYQVIENNLYFLVLVPGENGPVEELPYIANIQ